MIRSLRQCLLSLFCVLLIASLVSPAARAAEQYKHFRVAIYIPVMTVEKMKDPKWLDSSWTTITSQVKVDKIYIETYRSGHMADDALIEQVKKFFTDRGVQVAGGIAFTGSEGAFFQSFCYTDPADRAYVKRVSEFTARHFDEIILDDFFFVMTKRDSDIAAKGKRSWTDFRLDLMDVASRDLVVGPAHAVNPTVKVIIKYPNWYEHFQGLGFDLEKQPAIFDGIYTGTETRDAIVTDQHLQPYESYEIIRYFTNIAPGHNGGGWVDTFGVRHVDRYAEQLWDTMFAKAREMTLFNYELLLEPIKPGARDAWKAEHTSFDLEKILAEAGSSPAPTMALVAGRSLAQVDPVVGQLGNPIGIKSYRPYNATGEDFLHNYLGMIGIPIDLYPTFPTDASTVLLTESARFDAEIVSKIKRQLQGGKNVVITSGLLRALQGKGIEDIVELRYTDRKALVNDFTGPGGWPIGGKKLTSEKPILIPQIDYLTNDAWAMVSGNSGDNGFPLVIMDRYSKGTLWVLVVPENFADLYALPPEVIGSIKNFILGDVPIRLDAPGKVSLFAYDNNAFVVESFLDTAANATVTFHAGVNKIKNLETGEIVEGTPVPLPPWGPRNAAQQIRFAIALKPHSYAAFAAVK